MTRPRHPLEGRRLQVIGAMRRLGRDELLVVLPDGSKTLMPAGWTDRDTTTTNEDHVLDRTTAILAAPAQLLHAHELVASLRGPPRLSWRLDHLSRAAGCCTRLSCQKASSNSLGGTSPHQECNLSLLYQKIHSAVANVTSAALFHGPFRVMSSFL